MSETLYDGRDGLLSDIAGQTVASPVLRCQPLFSPPANIEGQPDSRISGDVPVKPPRPVFYPELGRFFQGLRDRSGYGLRQAATLAQNRHLHALTKGVLEGLEKGKTKNVDPDVLRAIATLYDQPYEDIVATVVRARYGVALSESADQADQQRATALDEARRQLARLRVGVALLSDHLALVREGLEAAEGIVQGVDAYQSPEHRTPDHPQTARRTRRARRG